MTTRSLFESKLTNIHRNLMEAHRDSADYAPSIVGAEREIVQRNLLSLILPTGYRLGTGTILDEHGHDSGQVDAVIEQPFSISFPVSSDSNRLYLASTVCAAFEIKSDLNAQRIEALEKIKKIKRLHRIRVNAGEHHLYDDVSIPAFVIGYKGPTSEERLEELFVQPRDRFYPNGILVIESELFYGRSAGGGWRIAQGKAPSILAFLACIVDSITYSGSHDALLDNYLPLIQSRTA